MARVKAAGVELTSPVTHGITHSVYFPDPDGNTLEIYSEVLATGEEGMAYMRAQIGYGITDPITL